MKNNNKIRIRTNKEKENNIVFLNGYQEVLKNMWLNFESPGVITIKFVQITWK